MKPIVDAEGNLTVAKSDKNFPYLGPQPDSSFMQEVEAGLAMRPEDTADYIKERFPDLGITVYKGNVYLSSPDMANAIESAEDMDRAIKNGLVGAYSPGLMASIVTSGPEIVFGGLGAALGTAVEPGGGTIIGAGAGTGLGNLVKQGIGSLLGVDKRPAMDSSRALETGASTVLGGLGEGLGIGLKSLLAKQGANLPSKAAIPLLAEESAFNKPIQVLGRGIEKMNEAFNTPYARAVPMENQAVVKDLIEKLVAQNAGAGLSPEVPSNALALNKALGEAIVPEFENLRVGEIGKAMNEFKQKAVQPYKVADLKEALSQAAQESAHPDIEQRIGKISELLTKPSKNAPEVIETALVDEAGNPKRMFHGTSQVFDEFDESKLDPNALFGKGFYFTESPEIAGGYTDKLADGLRRMEYQKGLDPRQATKKLIETIKLSDKVEGAEKQGLIRDANNIIKAVTNDDPFEHKIEGLLGRLDQLGIATDEVAKRNIAPNIKPAYLNVKNPFDMDRPAKDYLSVLKSFKAENPPATIKKWIDKAMKEDENIGSIDGLTGWLDNTKEAYEWAGKNGIEDWAQFLQPYEKYIQKKALGRIAAYMKDWKNPLDETQPATAMELFKEIQRNLGNWNNKPDFEKEVLQNMGFDGIVHTGGANTGNPAHKVAIAFDKNQILPGIGKKFVTPATKPTDDVFSPSIGEVIDRFQNLNSNSNFKASTDDILNAQLSKLRKTIKGDIDTNITSTLADNPAEAQRWGMLNKAYSTTMSASEKLKEALGKNRADNNRQVISKLIDNPNIGYEVNLPKGGIPPKLENLATRGFIQEKLADVLGEGNEDSIRSLAKYFQNAKNVDELKNIIGSENDYVLNQYKRMIGQPEVPVVPQELKASNISLADRLAEIMGSDKNVLKSPYQGSTLGSAFTTLNPITGPLSQAYYNPYGTAGRSVGLNVVRPMFTGLADKLREMQGDK